MTNRTHLCFSCTLRNFLSSLTLKNLFAILSLFLQLSTEYDESEEPTKEIEDAELMLSPFLKKISQAGTSDNFSFEEKERFLTELVKDKVSSEDVEQVL